MSHVRSSGVTPAATSLSNTRCAPPHRLQPHRPSATCSKPQHCGPHRGGPLLNTFGAKSIRHIGVGVHQGGPMRDLRGWSPCASSDRTPAERRPNPPCDCMHLSRRSRHADRADPGCDHLVKHPLSVRWLVAEHVVPNGLVPVLGMGLLATRSQLAAVQAHAFRACLFMRRVSWL